MSSSVPPQVPSINKAPYGRHDANPSSAAGSSKKMATSIEKGSEAGEEDYGVVSKPRLILPHAYPLPDLRFEQSYLKSMESADTLGKMTWVTFRDMMLMPFMQGIIYNFALCGWKHWNRSVQVSGTTVGGRIRKWWYGVNNWPLPRKHTSARL